MGGFTWEENHAVFSATVESQAVIHPPSPGPACMSRLLTGLTRCTLNSRQRAWRPALPGLSTWPLQRDRSPELFVPYLGKVSQQTEGAGPSSHEPLAAAAGIICPTRGELRSSTPAVSGMASFGCYTFWSASGRQGWKVCYIKSEAILASLDLTLAGTSQLVSADCMWILLSKDTAWGLRGTLLRAGWPFMWIHVREGVSVTHTSRLTAVLHGPALQAANCSHTEPGCLPCCHRNKHEIGRHHQLPVSLKTSAKQTQWSPDATQHILLQSTGSWPRLTTEITNPPPHLQYAVSHRSQPPERGPVDQAGPYPRMRTPAPSSPISK